MRMLKVIPFIKLHLNKNLTVKTMKNEMES